MPTCMHVCLSACLPVAVAFAISATVGVVVAYANADNDAYYDVDAPHGPFENAAFVVDEHTHADAQMLNVARHLASAFASVVAASTVA